MLVEIIRGMLCMICLVIAVIAIARSDWRILRMLLAMFVVAVMTPEVIEAVNQASTHIDDLGSVRKVGWPTIMAAILIVWNGLTWLTDDRSEPSQ